MAIVTSGLVASYFAGLAKSGIAPGNNSDPTSTWWDLIGDAHAGALSSFGWTTSSGWAGAGTGADPYRLVFDSTNTPYVDLGNVAQQPSTGYTIEQWIVYGTSSVSANLTIQGNTASGTTSPYVGMWISGNKAIHICRNDAATGVTLTGGTTLATGSLYHLVATCDGSNCRLYVNASSDATAQAPPSGTYTLNDIKVGARVSTLGRVSNGSATAAVRIYSRGLSSTEITQNYNAGVLATGLLPRRGLVLLASGREALAWQ